MFCSNEVKGLEGSVGDFSNYGTPKKCIRLLELQIWDRHQKLPTTDTIVLKAVLFWLNADGLGGCEQLAYGAEASFWVPGARIALLDF